LFKSVKGNRKLLDTPAHRELIEKVSNGTVVVTDTHGSSYYLGLDEAGKKIYTRVHSGIVKGSGYNDFLTLDDFIKYALTKIK
jgi:hypothetical protein